MRISDWSSDVCSSDLPEGSTPTCSAISPTRMWSVPPAEPPAPETDRGSALNFATRSSSVWISEAAGPTMTYYSPVRRAIGVVCSSDTGDLLVRIRPSLPWPPHHTTPPGPDHQATTHTE